MVRLKMPPWGVPGTAMLAVEGADLEAKIWGTGEVIIALPGLGSDVAWFKLLAPLLAAEGFQVIALNSRAVGQSRGSLNGLTMEILAEDVSNAIRALDLTRVHMLGWAFGNRVARVVAQNHPEQVATITLLAAGGLVRPSEPVLAAFRRLSEPGLDDSTRLHLMRECLYAPMSDIPALLAVVQPGKWPEARAAQIAAAEATTVEDWWAGGIAPMLIVQGRYDLMAPGENGLALVEAFPDRVKLVWVENAAHMMLVEQPAMVAAHVVAFLKDGIEGNRSPDHI